MVALLRIAAAGCLVLSAAAHAQPPAGAPAHRWLVQANLSLAAVDSGERSWLDGGLGKLRRDESDPAASLDRLLIDYRGALTPTLFAQLDVDYAHDGSTGFDLTEAYLEWRPVPRSPTRHRIRVGGFYPRISLENVAPGWETPFSISSSALNTWIAEEIKLLGAEWSLSRRIGGPGSVQEIGGFAAAFVRNDPAGTLLAWKGWAVHDRQTRWSEQLPLPPLPQLEPGTQLRQNQAPHAEPFVETDHAVGYLLGADWRYGERLALQVAHFDNHADPESIAQGQYGWRTRFDHAAVQAALPWDVGLIAQWLRGSTVMGPLMSWNARVVDTAFEAAFVLLTRLHDGHRFTVRFDRFSAEERDALPFDDNTESGEAVTLAYARTLSPALTLGVEWLRVDSDRPARTYVGLEPAAVETTLRVQLRWRLSASRSR